MRGHRDKTTRYNCGSVKETLYTEKTIKIPYSLTMQSPTYFHSSVPRILADRGTSYSTALAKNV